VSPESDRSAHFTPAAHPDDLGFALPEPAKPGAARVLGLIALAIAVLACAFFLGYMPRKEHTAALAHSTAQSSEALRLVEIVKPKTVQSTRPMVLTASLQPLAETVIFSRANGYVESFAVDIGERVKAGQVLAVIETPELDQQLDQAKAEQLRREAALGQAQTQAEYAKTSLARYERLRPAGIASQQELDQKVAESRVQEANVTAAAANIEVGRADVRRLQQLKSFARVTAPFAGIIVQRQVERGALVQPAATPLFRLADTDTLRAFVQVPQDLAVHVQPGGAAQVSVREYPGRNFPGTVTRAAGALDPATRTLTTEIRVDNTKHELLAGMYAEASLSIESSHSVYEVPATTLYNDADGLRVAIVDDADTIRFKTITLERDAGATLQISNGLRASDRVIKLADVTLREGDKVRVRTAGQ
jgi:membrane fusion protein, multidrug efflux system